MGNNAQNTARKFVINVKKHRNSKNIILFAIICNDLKNKVNII